jgi:hypothetical protein
VIGRSEIRKLLDRLVFSRVSLFWLLDLLQGELSRPAKAYRLTYSHGACKAWAWVRFILGGSLLPRHTETFFIRGRGDKFTVDSDISISISILSYYPIMLLYSESRGYTISYIRFFGSPVYCTTTYWSTFSIRWPFCPYGRVFFI